MEITESIIFARCTPDTYDIASLLGKLVVCFSVPLTSAMLQELAWGLAICLFRFSSPCHPNDLGGRLNVVSMEFKLQDKISQGRTSSITDCISAKTGSCRCNLVLHHKHVIFKACNKCAVFNRSHRMQWCFSVMNLQDMYLSLLQIIETGPRPLIDFPVHITVSRHCRNEKCEDTILGRCASWPMYNAPAHRQLLE